MDIDFMASGLDIEFWFSLGVIFLLLCFSAFFSGSETALTAASNARMQTLSKDKDNKDSNRANLVIRLMEKKERLIGGLLLGNNLVNIMASAMATSLLIKVFGETGVVYATLVMTLTILIFSEVMPKTYALNNADRVALKLAPVVRIVVAVFSPVTTAIIKIVQVTLRILGAGVNQVNVGQHYDILRGVIDMHQGDEDEIAEERAMLRSILELTDVTVEDIMMHRRDVLMIDADQDSRDIVSQVLDSPYTRLPLWRENHENIVGVLHTKLLLKEWHKCNGDMDKIDIKNATHEPWFIPEMTTLYDQLQEFRARREHFALVVDEYGAFMGIVTLEDILEEIVGDIDDEYDVTVKGVRPQPDGSYLIDGKVTIRDLNREFEWGLPDNEWSTLAGLILYETQTIPSIGQKFNLYDFRFEIMRKQRNQITLVRLTPPDEENHEIVET